MEMKTALRMRRKKKKKKPIFRRQEWFKQPMLGEMWRRPRGRKSKLRRSRKARGRKPGPGYSSPLSVRGLNRQGFAEVRIFNPNDLSKLDPKKQIGVIASTVGRKKREQILKIAKEKDLQLANQRDRAFSKD